MEKLIHAIEQYVIAPIHGEAKDWRKNFKEIFSAVIIVVVLNLLLVQNYLIPTGSMRPRLREGDRLFANRFVYGVKLPFTDGYEGLRLPKFKYPTRGDIVVFRAPPSAYAGCNDEPIIYPPSPVVQALKGPVFVLTASPLSFDPRILLADKLGEVLTKNAHPDFVDGATHAAPANTLFGFKGCDLDPRKEYVKRVIGLGGETLQILNKRVYFVLSITNNDGSVSNMLKPMTNDVWGKFLNDQYASPYGDNYGPVYIPKVGDVIRLSKNTPNAVYTNLDSYTVAINGEEVTSTIKIWYWMNLYGQFGKGQDVLEYKVKTPYYFVLGDNRNASCDSRYWGLVHYRFIKGQPMVMYWPYERAFGKEKYFLIR